MPMTFSSLTGTKGETGAIRTWVNNATIPADEILEDAQAYVNREMRVREMVVTTTGTLTASATALDCPSGYRKTVSLYTTYPDAYDFERRLPEDVEAMRPYTTSGAVDTGTPSVYAITGTQAIFDVATDEARTVVWRYYADTPALSTATETNFVTQRYPRALRAACMAYANEFMKDDAEKVYWMQIAAAEINAANAESMLEMGDARIDRDFT